MAKRKAIKRTHSTPGIYYKETVLDYPGTSSIGLTTLGIAGETVKGPAFQPISISNWGEFTQYFGGTNTTKFRGSQYPQYELPYIAQEYLKQSQNLEVVRTLGLSGVNAGPAWVISATKCIKIQGFEYTKDSTVGGNDKDVTMTSEKYNNTHFFCNPPAPVETTDGGNPYPNTTVYVIDSYRNTGIGIYTPGISDINILPSSFIATYGSMEEFYTRESEFPKDEPFMFINIEFISDGKLSLIYKEDGENDATVKFIKEFDLASERGISGKESDLKKKFIILTQADLQELSITKPLNEIALSQFVVYQYVYDNVNGDHLKTPNITGLEYKYNVNETAKDVYIEGDKNNDAQVVTPEYANVPICIIRSRGEHKQFAKTEKVDRCGNVVYDYDGINYYAKSVELKPYSEVGVEMECNPNVIAQDGDFLIDTMNYGKFDIVVKSYKGCEVCGGANVITKTYSVSLNPTDKNYIIKVLGTNPEIGDSDIYVEELYDVALEQLIYSHKINVINKELVYFPYVSIEPNFADVDDLLRKPYQDLKERDLGKRFLYTHTESALKNLEVHITGDNGLTWQVKSGDDCVGHIYTVVTHVDKLTGKREYFYGEYANNPEIITIYNYNKDVELNNYVLSNCVKVLSDDLYYIHEDYTKYDTSLIGDMTPITLDFNNYKEEYSYASTPWIVSELKGSGENINLHRLFRFHTISDGNTANTEVKVSIENIDPDNEVFDVVIREFNDVDVNPNILERFGKCSLVPGDSNYIGYKIGTTDGTYVSKSAYVTVEINEDDVTAMSIPCGFLGYPVRNYNGLGIYEDIQGTLSSTLKQPYMRFNTTFDSEVSKRKQYFGMSDWVGIDADILKYKGVEAYNDDPAGLTPGFHLDSRLLNGLPQWDDELNSYTVEENGIKQIVDVDGITGYTWTTVSRSLVPDNSNISPRIGTSDVMEGTIYSDKTTRKFTVCFYGGWDGWDYYRTSRSNGDEFKYNTYKGQINSISGVGTMFSTIKNPELYGFEKGSRYITSDYYAYLAAIKQLDNPKNVSINVFATPGIDYVNQKSLVHEVINMIEEERGDALYVVTTPDKPYGADDNKTSMYTPQEAVFNLEDSDIDSNYVCTYYPWGQYLDTANNQYIYLPITMDVVRNIAYTDNVVYSWYASAGWNRGDVTCVAPKRKLKMSEQDTLYDGRINYVNSFAKEGDKVWGDKNLQIYDNPMNRISKRRLLLRMKNELSTACVGLLFDPLDDMMTKTVKNIVSNVLEDIKSKRGISEYKVIIDDSAEMRDSLALSCKIFVKPIGMLEFIDFELVVTPQGVSLE